MPDLSFLQPLWRNEVMLSVTSDLTYASIPGEQIFAIPTRVLVELPSYHIIAFGHEARPVEHAGVKNAKVIEPCTSREIFDQTATTVFLRAVMQLLLGRAFLLKPKIYLSQASQVTPFMQELWQVCLFQAGAREVTMVHPLLATAAGAGLPVADSHGYAVSWWGEDRILFGLLAFGHVQHQEEFVVPVGAKATEKSLFFRQSWQVFLEHLPAEFRLNLAQEGVLLNIENAEPALATHLSRASEVPVTIVPRTTEVLGLQKWAHL